MKQQAKIIRPPHLLWTDGNGKGHYGRTVENLDKESVKKGYCDKWGINSFLLHNDYNVKEFLGLTELEYKNLLLTLENLESNNP